MRFIRRWQFIFVCIVVVSSIGSLLPQTEPVVAQTLATYDGPPNAEFADDGYQLDTIPLANSDFEQPAHPVHPMLITAPITLTGANQAYTTDAVSVPNNAQAIRFHYLTGSTTASAVPIRLDVEVLSGADFNTITRIEANATQGSLLIGWQQATLNIKPFQNQTIKLRFRNSWLSTTVSQLADLTFYEEVVDWEVSDGRLVGIGTDAEAGSAFLRIQHGEHSATSQSITLPTQIQSLYLEYRLGRLTDTLFSEVLRVEVLSGVNFTTVTRIDMGIKSALAEGWHETILPLHQFQGQTIRLRFVSPWSADARLEINEVQFRVETPEWTSSNPSLVNIADVLSPGDSGLSFPANPAWTAGAVLTESLRADLHFDLAGGILGDLVLPSVLTVTGGYASQFMDTMIVPNDAQTLMFEYQSGLTNDPNALSDIELWVWHGDQQNFRIRIDEGLLRGQLSQGWKTAQLDIQAFRNEEIRIQIVNGWQWQSIGAVRNLGFYEVTPAWHLSRPQASTIVSDSIHPSPYLIVNGNGQSATSTTIAVPANAQTIEFDYRSERLSQPTFLAPLHVEVITTNGSDSYYAAIDQGSVRGSQQSGWSHAVLDIQAFQNQMIQLRFTTDYENSARLSIDSIVFASRIPEWTPSNSRFVQALVQPTPTITAALELNGSLTAMTSEHFTVPPTASNVQFSYYIKHPNNPTTQYPITVEVLSGYESAVITRIDANQVRGSLNQGWLQANLDISAFRGRVIQLRFINHGNAAVQTQIGPLAYTYGNAGVLSDIDSSHGSNYAVINGSEQWLQSAVVTVTQSHADLYFDYQIGRINDGAYLESLRVDVLHGANFALSTRIDANLARASLNQGWKSVRLDISAFQGQVIQLRFTNPYGSTAQSRIDRVFLLASHTQLAAPPNVSACDKRLITGLEWSVLSTVSEDDGLIMENMKLKHRVMGKSMTVPYGVIAFKNNAGTYIGKERFELSRKLITGCEVKFEPAYYHSPSGVVERLVISATYLLTNFKNAPDAKLYVTQRYEFTEEINEDRYQELACEPSNENPATDIFGHPFSCARWKPIIRYRFEPGSDRFLHSVTFAQRVHLTPDDQPLRGTMVIHDCAAGEGYKDGTTLQEPCMFTKFVAKLFDITYAPPQMPNLLVPGMKLMQGKNTLEKEVAFDAIKGGRVTQWDNIHTTWGRRPAVPLPLPPGCPECVHIHWRWDSSFGERFGDGYPQVDNISHTPGIAGAILKEYRNSRQDVRIHMLRHRSSETDPISVESISGSESIVTSAGQVLWYVGTGYQDEDSFFAHGGFFSSTKTNPIDGSVTSLTYEVRNQHANQLTIKAKVAGFQTLKDPLILTYKMPAGWTYVGSDTMYITENACALEAHYQTILCILYPTAVRTIPPPINHTVAIHVIPNRSTETLHTFTILPGPPEAYTGDNSQTLIIPKQ